MSEFFFEVLAFLIKSGIFVISAVVIFAYFGSNAVSKGAKSRIKFIDLKMERSRLSTMFKNLKTGDRPSLRKGKKSESTADTVPVKDNTLFVLRFDGNASAQTESGFDHEVSAVIAASSPGDEVAVILKSPGGYVHAYGYATEHLKRLKAAGLKLTVSVDEIAASGGYMMASVADKIVAAPFSVIGSVGVVAEFPNFNGLLEEHGIDYKQYTAGEYKRTVGPMNKISEEAEEKFKKDLERTHGLFKDHIKKHRENVNVDEIATGETWYGSEAIEIGLIDAVGTSNDLVQSYSETHNLYFVRNEPKRALGERVSDVFSATAAKTVSLMNDKMIQNTRRY